MTSQFDFSNDQWKLVATTPLLVGMAVLQAEDSGYYGTFRETRTLMADLQNGDRNNPAASLISEVAAYGHEPDFEIYKAMSSEALAHDAARACAELRLVLQEVAETEEASGFKKWIVGLANDVAHAAREDGVRVSAGETAVINAVTKALG